MSRSSRIAAALAALAFSGGLMPVAVLAGAAPRDCGAFLKGYDSWYRHCTGDGSSVWVSGTFQMIGEIKHCVGPNQEKYFAPAATMLVQPRYTGHLCRSPR